MGRSQPSIAFLLDDSTVRCHIWKSVTLIFKVPIASHFWRHIVKIVVRIAACFNDTVKTVPSLFCSSSFSYFYNNVHSIQYEATVLERPLRYERDRRWECSNLRHWSFNQLPSVQMFFTYLWVQWEGPTWRGKWRAGEDSCFTVMPLSLWWCQLHGSFPRFPLDELLAYHEIQLPHQRLNSKTSKLEVAQVRTETQWFRFGKEPGDNKINKFFLVIFYIGCEIPCRPWRKCRDSESTWTHMPNDKLLSWSQPNCGVPAEQTRPG